MNIVKKFLAGLLVVAFILPACESTSQIKLKDLLPGQGGKLSSTEVANGLKEALRVGTDSATSQLSMADGFFANAAIKILMPPEAKKVESTLRTMGMGSVVDKAILSMNRAAEDAAKSAAPIFWNAIKGMSISDALGILKGGDFAATDYLKSHTTTALTAAFEPVVSQSLENVNATKYWADVFSVYNKFSSNKIETDLNTYVTNKAMDGIFHEIGLEEQKIRQDPAARVTDILKKVFAKQ